MGRHRILVLNLKLHQAGLDVLLPTCDVFPCPPSPLSEEDISAGRTEPSREPTREEILRHVKNTGPVDGIIWNIQLRSDKELLDAAGPSVKVIVSMSSGYDHLDVAEMKRRGIRVGRTPGVQNKPVAEVAVMLALMAGRGAREGRLQIDRGEWKYVPQRLLGYGLEDATIGIVGLGAIGQQIMRRLVNFDVARFIYSGNSPKKTEIPAEFVSFDQLLRESDFIFVACPLTKDTRRMFDAEAFKKMKRRAVLVNVARGSLIDQPALVESLRNGTIFAAGLDVTDPEPIPPDHEILKLSNAVVLPHMAACTYRARAEIAQLAARTILAGLAGEELPHPV